MTEVVAVWAAVLTVAIVVLYEIGRAVAQQRAPGRQAPSAHALLREEWLLAISAQQGSEILAVQTLPRAWRWSSRLVWRWAWWPRSPASTASRARPSRPEAGGFDTMAGQGHGTHRVQTSGGCPR